MNSSVSAVVPAKRNRGKVRTANMAQTMLDFIKYNRNTTAFREGLIVYSLKVAKVSTANIQSIPNQNRLFFLQHFIHHSDNLGKMAIFPLLLR